MRLFRDADLAFIRLRAEGCLADPVDERPEFAVFEAVNSHPDCRFNDRQRAILRFCAEECEKQRSGEMSVARMAEAYEFVNALKMQGTVIQPAHIAELLWILEPKQNPYGFRSQPVTLGEEIIPVPPDWDRVLGLLLDSYRDGDLNDPSVPEGKIRPEFEGKLDGVLRWYVKFEKLHPGNDGNGRAGAILYNKFRGSFDAPVAAPDVFPPKPE